MTRVLSIGFAALLLISAGVFAVYSRHTPDIRTRAHAIVSDCAGAGSLAKISLCYEKEVPALMDHGLSMQDAFAVTSEIQRLDTTYRYCHVLAHNISAKETAKDPSKWKDVIAKAPAGVCGNGALHGAFQERFRAESLPDAPEAEILSLIDGACTPRDGWGETLIERSSCYHGMGHLFVYITAAQIQKSVALCGAVTKGMPHGYEQTCDEGVFMQIYQPLEPEDRSLIHGIEAAAQKRLTFCSAFTGTAYSACIKESWPVMKDAILSAPGFEETCAPLRGDDWKNCMIGLTYAVVGMKDYNAQSMASLCSTLSTPQARDICVSATAVRFIETDWKNIPDALNVCDTAGDSASACWEALITYARDGMHPNSEETRALCSGMPELPRRQCIDATNTPLS